MENEISLQEKKVQEETRKLLEMHRANPGNKIKDYTLNTAGGPRTLSSFFGDKKEMFLIHNMGKKCSYCTLWADGINGFTDHMKDRAALLVVSGDDVVTQTDFANSRGWRFPMASTQGTTLFQDLGFHDPKKELNWPGVSIIARDADGTLWQKARASFGPGDLFSSIWNFIGMLPSNVDWSPKYKY